MGQKDKVRAKVIPPEAPPVRPVRRIRSMPMTDEEYLVLARQAAREEIMVVAKTLAAQVHNGVQQTMVPLNERFAEIYKKCNELDIHIHALVELLAAKGVITKPEVREAAERVTSALVARQEALKKALKAEAEKAAGDAEASDAAGEA